jgi:hypothetical protein
MSRAALSAFVWGVYLIIAGLGLLLMPNFVLPLLGFATTAEGWVRVLGLLASILGMYYIFSARWNIVPFFQLTVAGRLAFMAGCIGLVISGLMSPSLLIFGGLDAIGAIWTWLSLRGMTEASNSVARA